MSAERPAPAFKRPEIVEGTELIYHAANGRDRAVVRVVRRTATRLIVDTGARTLTAFLADSLYVPGAARWRRERLETPRDAAHIAEVREEAHRAALLDRFRRYPWGDMPIPALDAIAAILDAIEARRAAMPSGR